MSVVRKYTKVPLRFLLAFFFVAIHFPNFAQAVIFPPTGNEDVIHISDFDADLATKLYLIDNAKESIALSSFSIGRDLYGVNVVRALRNALLRGVHVRILYESFLSRVLGNDPLLLMENLLLDPQLPLKAEIISMRPLDKLFNGLRLYDFVHQKLLLIDSGTENESAFFGGRDPYAFASKTLDSGFLIRPIDPMAPYLGDHLTEQFDLTWNTLLPKYRETSTTHLAEEIAQALNAREFPTFSPTGSGLKIFHQITSLLSHRPVRGESLLAFQFRPRSTQLLTNSLLYRLASGKTSPKILDDPAVADSDDLVKTLASLIEKAHDVEISSYSAAYERQILLAIYDCTNANGTVRVYTDGRSAMVNMDDVSGLLGRITRLSLLGYLDSMSAMWEVKSLSHHPENLKVFGTDIEKLRSGSENLNYLHRKLIVIDRDIVISGSYNYTPSSTTKNDEFTVIFEDLRMNSFLRGLNQSEEQKYFKEIDPLDPSVEKDIHDHKIREWLLNGLTRDIS